jgi:hypothetical protein
MSSSYQIQGARSSFSESWISIPSSDVDAPDFYLASSEGYGLETPRRCYRLRRILGRSDDDYLIVKVDPPIIGQRYVLVGVISTASFSQLDTKGNRCSRSPPGPRLFTWPGCSESPARAIR